MAKGRTLLSTRRNVRRQAVMKTATIREFDGGWNVIDNDLNLSTRFAKVLTNMVRQKDGSIGVRQGTRIVRDYRFSTNVDLVRVKGANGQELISATGEYVFCAHRNDAYDGTLDSNPFTFTNSSSDVVVSYTGHNLITGHTISFTGATTAHGIPADELNDTHIVTVIDADSFQITVTSSATSDGTGGGSDCDYLVPNDVITDRIINQTYFDDRIIAVARDGVILEIDGSGNARIIFNDNIGNEQSGAPGGWGTTEFASFAVFNGELIICNGVDKPLIVNFNVDPDLFPCQYLADLATSSNANTPVCRYVVSMPNYVIMSGDPLDPGAVYISNVNTSGTWSGDSAPNDAVTVDVGKVAQAQNNIIRGIGRFRDTLVVMFDEVIVFGVLGIYDESGNHTPDFSDGVDQHGTVSHRAIQNLGNDLLMCDAIGVPSIARSKFTEQLRPDRVSQLIDPEIQEAILELSVGSTEDRMFSVYDQREGRYMLFIPNADTYALTTETAGFIYTSISALKVNAWAKFEGWNWSCGTRSLLGRMFFCEGTRMYVLGADEDPIYADFVNDVQRDDVSDTSVGKGIDFAWELPWRDFDKRLNIKMLRYLSFDASGSARFNAKVFVDNLYRAVLSQTYSADDAETLDYYFDDSELIPYALSADAFDPALELVFAGGSDFGYTNDDPLVAADERLRAANVKCKILKLRVDGTATAALSVISITLGYHEGSILR